MPRTTTKQTGSQARRVSLRRAFSFVHSSDQLDRFYGDLGKRIRELRQQQGLTQEDLAQKAQVVAAILRRLKRGNGALLCISSSTLQQVYMFQSMNS